MWTLCYSSVNKMKSDCFVYFVFINLFVCINSQSELYEGDDCDLSQNKGVCVELSLCPSAMEMVKEKQHPLICGFKGNIPIVCCEKTQSQNRLADQKCQTFQNINSATTFKKKRDVNNDTFKLETTTFVPDIPLGVIGGVNAVKREFPHMAALGYERNNDKYWLCGGTLISEQYILTAAHCLVSNEYGSIKWVRLGEINPSRQLEALVTYQYQVINTIAHPSYQAPSVYNDIALVQLDREVVFTQDVKPACLFAQDNIPNNVELLATGWGLTQVGGNQSLILQKVDLELFTENECDTTYKKTRRLKNGILHGQQICVGSRSKEKDTCQGDSGGPLQIKINDVNGERFYIIGVTSFGRSCGIPNVPGIYSRVSYFVPWIESVLWGQN